MKNNSYYTKDELIKIGFKSIGENVLVSQKISIYSPQTISIGNNVRIDDFCILSGEISIGNNVHISSYCALYGGEGIFINDFSGLSPRCTVFSSTDDFSGNYLVGVTQPIEKRNVIGGHVIIEKYCQIGANCVILPNLIIHEGVAVGAMSLITKSLLAWHIYAGIPVKKIKKRSNKMIDLL